MRLSKRDNIKEKTNGNGIYEKKEDNRSFHYSEWYRYQLWNSNENTL
jgi:hypothetical protein